MSPTAARADSVCVAGTPGWMLSGSGQTPCQVAESLVRVCTSTAQVQHLATDVSCATLGTPSDSECCCSTVTYALVAGCWVCQTGRPPSQLATTYAVWLAGCNLIRNVLPPAVLSAQPPIDAPHWAFVRPSNPNATWDIDRAANDSLSASSATIPSTSSPASTPSSPSHTSSELSPTQRSDPAKFPAAPVAIACAAALIIVVAMALWLYRRRNRVSPSSRPPPGFSIDEAETPPHEAGQERVGVGGWTWWKKTIGKKSGQDQGSRSDPGKIDAWHYPFEYTPVSANSSPGAGAYPPGQTQYVTANGHAHGPGYYDPYVGASTSRVTLPAPSGDDSDYELRRRERRERRERRRGRNSSETNLLAGRVSADGGLGAELRGQASHATLRYSPTPGASPGHHPGQPPYGVPPGYSSSHLQAGPGHSRSHSGTPTPGLFGTITPYVPPTTPTSHTSRPGGHSPIPPSGHSPVPPSGHSPHPSGHSPLPTGHSPTPPSTAPNPQYPQSPRAHTHTHTFEVQLSPGQYAELRSRYPDIRVRTRRHRRRDRDRDRDRARSGDEGDEEDGERRGRPRSWSVPAPGPALPAAGPPSPEEDQDQLDDGRPRNGPELAEKYRRRRRRRGTDAEAAVEAGAGVAGKSSEVDVVRPRETRERRGRERALDGGISLMGGPPRVR